MNLQRATIMNRKLLAIIFVATLTLSWISVARTAGVHDGTWEGSATVINKGRCEPSSVSLSVNGNEAIGQAKFVAGIRRISGTVAADGTFGGTIGFQQIEGKFTGDDFEGTFVSFECAWKISLKRTN
jgi:hypothetical protein